MKQLSAERACQVALLVSYAQGSHQFVARDSQEVHTALVCYFGAPESALCRFAFALQQCARCAVSHGLRPCHMQHSWM